VCEPGAVGVSTHFIRDTPWLGMGKATAALLLEYAALNNCNDHYLEAGGGNNTACGATFLTGAVVFR